MRHDELIFLCEICGCAVEVGDAAARVVADSGISDGHGGVYQSEVDEEVVFAVFHTSCLIETRRQQGCDSVPYVEEAREVVDGKPAPRPRLVLYRGGLA